MNLKKIPFFTRNGLIGLIVLIICFRSANFVASLSGVQKVELGLRDQWLRSWKKPFNHDASPIVIVAIDDESYDALDAVWPWPRSYYARLIRNLNRAGAKLIAFDVMLDKERVDDPLGDDSLSAALAEASNVILVAQINTESNLVLGSGGGLVSEGKSESITLPASKFSRAKVAFSDVTEDIDGVVRNYLFRHAMALDSVAYPMLAVQAYSMFTGTSFGPAFNDRTFTIDYPGGRKTFPYVSFYQVVDDSTILTRDEREWGSENNWYDTLLAAGRFKDKIVFVGSSMESLRDVKLTPFSVRSNSTREPSKVPGVEVHTAALYTLMQGDRLHTADLFLVYTIVGIICLLLFGVGMTRKTVLYAVLFVVCTGLWFVAAWFLFGVAHLIIPAVGGALCFSFVFAGQPIYLFFLERQRRRSVTGMFGHYVPAAVVAQLINEPSKLTLGGERRELSVLFSDLAGFTTISEKLLPETLVELLNEYLTAMTEVILNNGGIIDKYEGDLIMAEFGIPIAVPDHALRACRSALAMQRRLAVLRDEWCEKGLPVVMARTGIGTGDMIFGNMGSNQVFDYTVIGDTVNLASRLEGANKMYGTCIMINQGTFVHVREQMLCRELDLLRVKGKQLPERCYELIAESTASDVEDIRLRIAGFEKGVLLYRSQQWEQAIENFNNLLLTWPDDAPSALYLDRCRTFLKNPPEPGWDGVYTMQSK